MPTGHFQDLAKDRGWSLKAVSARVGGHDDHHNGRHPGQEAAVHQSSLQRLEVEVMARTRNSLHWSWYPYVYAPYPQRRNLPACHVSFEPAPEGFYGQFGKSEDHHDGS